jgi:hypothetical protein
LIKSFSRNPKLLFNDRWAVGRVGAADWGRGDKDKTGQTRNNNRHAVGTKVEIKNLDGGFLNY